MIPKPGQKLQSAVCDAQVVVVRVPTEDVELGCGGALLLAEGDAAPEGVSVDPALADGALIGKRYADESVGLELLCTKAGTGSLTCNGEVLPIKGAKPLPASD